MKTRFILPLAVFGLLLAALFASSCIGGGFSDDQFGGPYTFGWRMDEPKKIVFEGKKRKDFECYKETDLSLSEAVKLTDDILRKYMEADTLFGDEDMQKYNYVIDTNGKIIVAQWNDDVEFEEFRDRQQNAGPKGGCAGKQCLGDGESASRARKGVIINWFPETVDNPQSPCWLDRDEGDGLLDAISKHLMLAQGKGTTIEKYVPEWTSKDVKVAYAGELIVDLVSCTYSVNNDSGTYRPHAGTLAVVAKHFAKEIDVGPNLYVDVVFDPTTKAKSGVPHSTDNLFDTTTKISNCP